MRFCLCGIAMRILLFSQVMETVLLLETQFSYLLLCDIPSRFWLSLQTSVTKTQLSLGHVGSQFYTVLEALGTVMMVAVCFLRVTDMSGFRSGALFFILNSYWVGF